MVCISTPPNPPANDDCENAIVLPVNTDLTCENVTVGTTAGAIQSLAGCRGIADDDVWYEFVATATSHRITTSEVTEDIVLEFFSDNCGHLNPVACIDKASRDEIYQLTDLTIGDTYRFRIYTYYALRIADFKVCISTPPNAPDNDDCDNAITLMVNPDLTCANLTSGTTTGATQSLTGCRGTADDDVWYKFVATASWHQVQVVDLSTDISLEIYADSCAVQSSLACEYFNRNGGTYQINYLQTGQTYYIRLYTYDYLDTTNFNICIGAPTSICSTGDVTLTTQEEVHTFVAAFSNCDSLQGNLTISSGNAITDLSPLSFITYIAGDLKITNNYKLSSINGLDNLTEVRGRCNY